MERELKTIYILLVMLPSLMVSCSGEKGSEGLITASGTIEATDVYVRTEVPGIILDYKLKEGDRVEQGDLICRLDSEKLEIQLQQARARQKELQYRLALIRKGARTEEIERAKSSLEKALSNLKDAERNYQRAKELFQDEALPPAELDKAKLRVEVNQRLVEISQKEYEILQQGSRPEEVKMAEAALEGVKHQVAYIQAQLADTFIYTPRKGIIAQKLAEEGEYLPPGGLVAKIIDVDNLWLMVYLTEVEFGRVKLGDQVRVTVDSYPEHEFTGRIIYLSPEAEFTPKNIQTKEERVKLVFGVRVGLEDPSGLLKPGMPADAVLKPHKIGTSEEEK
ncbi:hypothetical protein CEE39_02985 [bacterium (candidate division B38) B3_B38]|nr:MAG: hypothetical protein CEE39_02985 [bacterium (candidate division B38) B3_B38]